MPVSWSRVVRDPEQARAALAAPGDALDLRAAAALDDAWAALGFAELVPGELVRPLDLRLGDLAATRALGARIAGHLRAGDLLLLSGPLGAGKTSLTQGVGAALGVRGAVTSPTFVLARTHRGPLPLTHVDAYRLRDAVAGRPDAVGLVADLDLEAALEDGVVVVEWGDGLVEDLAPSRVRVELSRAVDDADGRESRTARVHAQGPRWALLPLLGDPPPPLRAASGPA